ncbi:uncharacterized protein BDW70DRAFT_129786 [Aspergillus foveolatus]|uniref:uncharacterized protein n=1 Tax=Aspergillus foveolatus TaxID=210207 RepID=UPI003CCCB61A
MRNTPADALLQTRRRIHITNPGCRGDRPGSECRVYISLYTFLFVHFWYTPHTATFRLIRLDVPSLKAKAGPS